MTLVCGPGPHSPVIPETPVLGARVVIRGSFAGIPRGRKGTVVAVRGDELAVFCPSYGGVMRFFRHELRWDLEQPKNTGSRVDVCRCGEDHPAHRVPS